jgi:RimJ/RimL family protein N-acetyltransferase
MKLITHRLIIRDFLDDDFKKFEEYHLDQRFNEFYSEEEMKPEFLKNLFEIFQTWANETPRTNFQFCITEKDFPDSIIGCCGLRTKECISGNGELGIELSPDYWGKYKYAIEILSRLTEFGFNELNLIKISGRTLDVNSKVGKLANYYGASISYLESANWVKKKGWKEVEWQLTKEKWLNVAI